MSKVILLYQSNSKHNSRNKLISKRNKLYKLHCHLNNLIQYIMRLMISKNLNTSYTYKYSKKNLITLLIVFLMQKYRMQLNYIKKTPFFLKTMLGSLKSSKKTIHMLSNQRELMCLMSLQYLKTS